MNKSLSLRLKSSQAPLFRKIILKLRRFAKLPFFKEMVNIIMIVILKRKSSQLLVDFISSKLSLMKRHYKFLSTIKRCLSLFVSSTGWTKFHPTKFETKKIRPYPVLDSAAVTDNVHLMARTKIQRNTT